MLSFFIVPLAFGQSRWCGMTTAMDKNAFQNSLEKIRDQLHHSDFHFRADNYYQVVVHVVLTPDQTPISKAQIIHQIETLNDDFAGRGKNVYKVLDEFRPNITDTGIRFCLASVDPNGNPTDGITYTITEQENIALISGEFGRIAIHYNELGGKTGWDPTRYINIWVGAYGSFLGSANFPDMAKFPEEIGVVINNNSFGALGDAAMHGFFNEGHTLTHEMGHFFGLLHIWGDDDHDCNDSDEVDDTPNQEGPYLGCPAGIQTSCGMSNMYQNFMDLTDDRCLAFFTAGQSARMHASIDAFYSDLDTAPSCQKTEIPFDDWYDELIWATDSKSGEFLIMHPSGKRQIIKVEVFSVDGRLVLREDWDSSESFLLDLDSYASGVFFVRLSDGSQERTRKIVTYR